MAKDLSESLNFSFFEPSIRAGFLIIPKSEDRPSSIASLKQVHGRNGYRISKDDLASCQSKEGDWLWTTETHLRIGVSVADCTAILLSGDSEKYGLFLSAIHAGWRGTAERIIEKVFEELRPRDGWTVWLSPSICQSHFEVGGEVLGAIGPEARAFASEVSNGKYLLDLKRVQLEKLKRCGDGKISSESLCTYCEEEFYSYRREGPQLKGRHLAWIERVS